MTNQSLRITFNLKTSVGAVTVVMKQIKNTLKTIADRKYELKMPTDSDTIKC